MSDSWSIKVVSERENAPLGRKEIYALILHEGMGTPSYTEVRRRVAESYRASIESVYIISMQTEYGIGRSKCRAHVYYDPKRGEEVEEEYIKRRNRAERGKGGDDGPSA